MAPTAGEVCDSDPIRHTFPVCCASEASDLARMLPPTMVMNARRFITG